MDFTTVRLSSSTKKSLDKYKEYKNESYEEVILKLITIAEFDEDNAELSEETVKKIEQARQRIKKGESITLEELRKRSGR